MSKTRIIYDANTEYWPEGKTVIDRDGNVVFGFLRPDAVRSEEDAKKVADALNSGKTVEEVRKSRAKRSWSGV